jgi:membrane-bound lytic murein transglycosylase D
MFVARLSAFALLGLGLISGPWLSIGLAYADTIVAPTLSAQPPGGEFGPPALVEPLPANDVVQSEIPIQLPEDLPPQRTIDLTTPPDDLWQRVRNGFAMPDLVSPLVADRQAWYLNRPEMLRQILERSRRYLYHIVGELEKRGMPTELALLPIVESAYNPMAYSSARALGMWQFIPSTGRNYRLEQNWWLDQRRDIVASTSAALDYLQTIYEMNGDWHLALASYNWGEHAVARAVLKNRAKGLPTDYLHLTMPGETRYYVPKLQALKNIIAQPELFHIKLDPLPNRPYFGTVARSSNMDISVAAKLAEIPVDEFLALNPAYNRPMMPAANGSPLVLPADKVETYVANLERYQDEDKALSDWQTYTLKKGERIDAVASRFGLSGARLRQINGISSRTRIAPGHALLVPGKDAQGSANQVAAKLPAMPSETGRGARKSGKSKGHGKRHGAGTTQKKPAGTKHKKHR